MRYRSIIAFFIIVVIILNILYILYSINEPLNKKITTNSVGGVNITVEQVCGDTFCNNPETCTSCSRDCGTCPSEAAPGAAAAAGGGGGGGAVEKVVEEKPDFEVSQGTMKFTVKIGTIVTGEFNVKNTGNMPLVISIDVTKISDLLSVSPQTISLQPGESKNIRVTVFAKQGTELGLHTGKITINSRDITKSIDVTVEVESKKVLFDISLDIPVKYKQVLPGDEIVFNPTIFSLADIPNPLIEVTYLIKDFEGNTIIELNETLRMQDQITYTKTIRLPATIIPGRYVAAMYIRYKDSFGMSSNIFDVVEKLEVTKPLSNKVLIFGTIIFLLLIIALSSFLYYEHLKLLNIEKTTRKNITKITLAASKAVPSPEETSLLKSKLQKQMELLQKSYTEGYITKPTYMQCKNKINEAMFKLEK